MLEMTYLKHCELCISKCPQAQRAREAALGRMYATKEFIALQKKIEDGQLVDVTKAKTGIMRLVDLLSKVYKNTTVWIAEDPTRSEGIYFGAAGDAPINEFENYEIVELYPEHFPAIGNFVGISIIVQKMEA